MALVLYKSNYLTILLARGVLLDIFWLITVSHARNDKYALFLTECISVFVIQWVITVVDFQSTMTTLHSSGLYLL